MSSANIVSQTALVALTVEHQEIPGSTHDIPDQLPPFPSRRRYIQFLEQLKRARHRSIIREPHSADIIVVMRQPRLLLLGEVVCVASPTMALASLEEVIRDPQVIQHHGDPQTSGASTDDGDWEIGGSAAAKGRKSIALDESLPGERFMALPLVAARDNDPRVQAHGFRKRELNEMLGDFGAEGVVDHDGDGSQVRVEDTQNSRVAFIPLDTRKVRRERECCVPGT